jgi:glycosyltransferase involved in cell wall biosynthesis
MARRRVHFVNRYFHPDHSATSQLVSDLAFHLTRMGWEVLVTTSRQRYDDSAARLASSELVHGVDIHRAFSSTFGRSNLLGRAIDYATFYAGAFFSLLKHVRRGDVVVAMTDPPLISVVAGVAAWLRNAHQVNWVQDLFPEVAEAAGMRVAGITSGVRNWSLRRAAVNVAISDGMASRLRALGSRAVVLHNWADSQVHPVERRLNRLRDEWHLGDDVVVEYSGNFGRAHDVKTIADAVLQMPGQRFIFIGGGSGMLQLRRLLSGAENAMFLDYQPRERLAESLSAGDIHLVTLLPEFDGLIAPSKVYGIMAAGRPIVFVGDPDGDAAGIITRHECGIAIATGDSTALVTSLTRLAGDPALRGRLGGAARREFERSFTSSGALERWTSILEEVSQ